MKRLALVSKYRNKPTEVDNIRFASKKEAARYQELKLCVRAGIIKDLELQVRFPLIAYGALICTYVADFRYTDTKSGKQIVEDVKGTRTREYTIKKKLMKALYQIEIRET
jgi:hypothetical protein